MDSSSLPPEQDSDEYLNEETVVLLKDHLEMLKEGLRIPPNASKKDIKEILVETKGGPEVLCNECKKPIQGKIVSALGKTWHPEHFTCASCKKPISGGKFNQQDGKPFCEDDYSKLYLKKCAGCNQPIKEKMIIALEQNWHQEHFVCHKCNKQLAGLSFVEKDGHAYCQDDYHALFSPKCYGCKQPITDTAIVALEQRWHHQCFKCSKCNRPILEASFEIVDNKPICSTCSN